jgi:hypothetical protein
LKLRSDAIEVCRIGTEDRDVMFRLMEQNYCNMRRDRFDADLDSKRWVIQVRCPDTLRLVGFSTQVVLESQIDGRRVRALYSGDTVMDRDYWGDPALAHAWGNFALELADRNQDGELYWFLTSKGFRTYRYLPLFFHTYYPLQESPTPPWERSIIDVFGRLIGRETYDPRRMIIRAGPHKDFVRGDIADPGMRLSTDRHIRFFVECNPGFGIGDELCCLAPLSRANFTRAAHRVILARIQPLEPV